MTDQTVPTNPAPVTTPVFSASPPQKNSPLPIILIVAVLVIALIGGGAIFGMKMLQEQKAKYKSLVSKQLNNINQLQKKYDEIVTIVKEKDKETPKSSSTDKKLLKFDSADLKSNPNVLGLEDTPQIVASRKLTEVFRQTKPIIASIEETDTELETLYKQSPLKSLLPDPTATIAQTKKYATLTKYVLAYHEQTNELAIKLTSAGYEVGTALVEAIAKEADKASVQKLETKIDELKTLITEMSAIDISHLTDELKTEHKKALELAPKQLKIFTDMLDSLKKKDAQALISQIKSLSYDSSTASETSKVKEISYWTTNKELRGIEDIQAAWKKLQTALE